MEKRVFFRGQVVDVIERRLEEGERKPHLFYYGIRHRDNDGYITPYSLQEHDVLVNWFGYLVTANPLDTSLKTWWKLKPSEREIIGYCDIEEQAIQVFQILSNFKLAKLKEVVKDRAFDFSDIDDCFKIGKEACYRKGFEEDLFHAADLLERLCEYKNFWMKK